MVFSYKVVTKISGGKKEVFGGIVFGDDYELATYEVVRHYEGDGDITEVNLKLIESADDWLIECDDIRCCGITFSDSFSYTIKE